MVESPEKVELKNEDTEAGKASRDISDNKLKPKKISPTEPIDALKGQLKKPDDSKSLERP